MGRRRGEEERRRGRGGEGERRRRGGEEVPVWRGLEREGKRFVEKSKDLDDQRNRRRGEEESKRRREEARRGVKGERRR